MIERYSNTEIASLWKLESKFRYWLQVELAVCKAWNKRGLIPDDAWEEIQKKADFQTERILAIESEVQHDMIAFLTNVRENTGPAGRYLHYALTSSDVGDTALALQLQKSTRILLDRLDKLIASAAKQALRYKDQVMIGRTHGIHSEPTTLGLKFALFYAELRRSRRRLERAGSRQEIAVGKLSGAVGTFSNIEPEIEEEVCKDLGLGVDLVTTQVIGRDRHAYYCSILALIAGSLERMAQEVRLLQKTEAREVEEPFAKGQKGSSAMPHKRNPVICERICGIARVIQANAQSAYRNIALWHERDISHSSAERIILPDSIIALEYILTKMDYVISNLHVYPENMQRSLQLTGGLFYSQKLLLALVERAMQREEAYALVQEISMRVWQDKTLHLQEESRKNKKIFQCLGEAAIHEIFSLKSYLSHVDTIFRRLHLL